MGVYLHTIIEEQNEEGWHVVDNSSSIVNINSLEIPSLLDEFGWKIEEKEFCLTDDAIKMSKEQNYGFRILYYEECLYDRILTEMHDIEEDGLINCDAYNDMKIFSMLLNDVDPSIHKKRRLICKIF